MAGVSSNQLHPVGQTGNNNSANIELTGDSEKVCLEVIVEAIGATPTATFALEGSMDGANWFPARVVPSDSETVASNATYTTTGRRLLFLKSDLGHWYRFYRCACSANTNVTYSSKLHTMDEE